MSDDHAVRIAVLEERFTAMREQMLAVRKAVDELDVRADELERTRIGAEAVGRSAADAAVRRLAVGGIVITGLAALAQVVVSAVWG